MFTLYDCITRINQILNYPSITYMDISHFFDQAISELNTSFRIQLPLVSQMIDENRIDFTDTPEVVFLKHEPYGNTSDIVSGTIKDFTDTSIPYYNTDDQKLYKYDTKDKVWKAYDSLYGIYLSSEHERKVYRTVVYYGSNNVVWVPMDDQRVVDFDLTQYLPEDWIILFLIPYVCFKTSVRDGSNGALYNEEYTQGFQQLQTSYDVPNFIKLNTVVHLPAYKHLVKDNLHCLDRAAPTRAITSDMAIGNAVAPVYSDNMMGGWGF